jgi:hypothetical protein
MKILRGLSIMSMFFVIVAVLMKNIVLIVKRKHILMETLADVVILLSLIGN